MGIYSNIYERIGFFKSLLSNIKSLFRNYFFFKFSNMYIYMSIFGNREYMVSVLKYSFIFQGWGQTCTRRDFTEHKLIKTINLSFVVWMSRIKCLIEALGKIPFFCFTETCMPIQNIPSDYNTTLELPKTIYTITLNANVTACDSPLLLQLLRFSISLL